MFWFHLARVVEHTLDVEGLMARTPQRVFVQWRKYYELCPFGDDWDQAAVVASASFNPHVRRARKVEDFKPKFKRSVTGLPTEADNKRIFDVMHAFAAAHNATCAKR